MPTELVQFDDWSGGDEGRHRPVKSDPRKIRGTNAWTYPSGGLGPRPPFQKVSITGLPQAKLNVFHLMRPSTGGVSTRYFFGFSDGKVYMVPSGTNVATLVGTMTNPPVDAVTIGDYVYFVSNTGHGAKCSAAGVLSGVSAMPAGDAIEQLGDRTVITNAADGGVVHGKIRVSAAANPDEWPAANEIRIGAQNQMIMGVYVQRNTLVLPKFDGGLWVMRGVPTVNEVLRQEDLTALHTLPRRARGAVCGQSNLWYCSDRDMVKFTGAQAVLEPRPDIPVTAGYNVSIWSNNVGAVAPLVDDDEFVMVGTVDQTADTNTKLAWVQIHRPQDGWTRHVPQIGPFRVTYPTEVSTDNSTGVQVAKISPGGIMFLCSGSDTSANSGRAPQVYVFNSRQEYPHIPVGDVNSWAATSLTLNDGDSSAPVVADVRMAEHWDDEGRQLTVTSVVVDYSYNPNITPLSTYNRFDISVEALQNPGSSTVVTSSVQSFVPTGSGSTPDGSPIIRGQERFGFGDQGAGMGFRIRFSDWRGIVIHRVTVFVDATDGLR